MAVNSNGDQEPIAARTRSQIYPSPKFPHFNSIQPLDEPVAERPRSSTLSHNYTTPSHSRDLAAQILMHAAYSVLDNDTGKQLNYGQLKKTSKVSINMEQIFRK